MDGNDTYRVVLMKSKEPGVNVHLSIFILVLTLNLFLLWGVILQYIANLEVKRASLTLSLYLLPVQSQVASTCMFGVLQIKIATSKASCSSVLRHHRFYVKQNAF